ncbi:MAG: hypothetical protein GX591_11935 [Planctomycetes bacterium]|nr:hypothetical protein [Planctomycetota bacterium]
MSMARMHYIRTIALDVLYAAQPYGIAHGDLVSGLIQAEDVFIARDEAEVQIDWLLGKGLLEVVGAGDRRRLKVSPKGVTFVGQNKPWAQVEVLD